MTQDLAGMDMYRLPHGTTVEDAINGVNGARKFTYVDGGGTDGEIVITPTDLGLTEPCDWNGFAMQASTIFREMNDYHKERQQEDHLAT